MRFEQRAVVEFLVAENVKSVTSDLCFSVYPDAGPCGHPRKMPTCTTAGMLGIMQYNIDIYQYCYPYDFSRLVFNVGIDFARTDTSLFLKFSLLFNGLFS